MKTINRITWYAIAGLVLLLLPAGVSAAAPAPEYTTTYTITVHEDGSAIWQIEYRTALESDADVAGFEAYTHDLPSVYLPQVQDLMQRSAAQASAAASRPMQVSNVCGSAVIQLSPTGKFGVVIYTFTWEDFSQTREGLEIGDAFSGGMYLAKDSTLIISYPESYTIISVDPTADQQRDTLTWYGQRSFAPGEPRIVLAKNALPVIPAVLIIVILIVLISAGAVFLSRRKVGIAVAGPEQEEPDEPVTALSADELKSVDDRILRFLSDKGGEQYQSDIVKILGLPRSTVSASLNNLHKAGMIVKVRKGRENLIRLVKKDG
ncbi:MAG: ArsR family transcriptional regulator [Methanomicrobiales archaeon]|nr:ArsR family transcriptional regulator [Methanomicrobiales archaeon]